MPEFVTEDRKFAVVFVVLSTVALVSGLIALHVWLWWGWLAAALVVVGFVYVMTKP